METLNNASAELASDSVFGRQRDLTLPIVGGLFRNRDDLLDIGRIRLRSRGQDLWIRRGSLSEAG